METVYCQVNEEELDTLPVPSYTDVEHETWSLLLEKQNALVPGRACEEFISGLGKVQFPKDRIPALKDISTRITACTGWRLIRVEGLVHPTDFFGLLSRKVF